jgi:Flp pilus assembly protein TadD
MSLGAASRANDPTPPAHEPGPGPGHGYRRLDRIGGRPGAEVWRAEAPGGFRVALRFLSSRPQVAEIERRVLRLLRAAQHPNLVVWLGAWHENGYLVLASELADRSLKDRHREAIARGEPGIPRDELLGYLADAAEGLDHLATLAPHGASGAGRGVQHRAVRPQNLHLFGTRAKLGDLGLAWLREPGDLGIGGRGAFAYAAPELLRREPSSRSDQYALAVTYCQLRAGRLPFEGGPTDALVGHLLREPDLGMLPEAERPAVARALAKDPADRWPDARSFVAALRAAGTAPPPEAEPAPPAAVVPLATTEVDGEPEVPSSPPVSDAAADPETMVAEALTDEPATAPAPAVATQHEPLGNANPEVPQRSGTRRSLALLALVASALAAWVALDPPFPARVAVDRAPGRPPRHAPSPEPASRPALASPALSELVESGDLAAVEPRDAPGTDLFLPAAAPGPVPPAPASDADFARVLDEFVVSNVPDRAVPPASMSEPPAVPAWDPAVELAAAPATPPALVPPAAFPRDAAPAADHPAPAPPEVPASELAAGEAPAEPLAIPAAAPAAADPVASRWLGQGPPTGSAPPLQFDVPEAPLLLAGESGELTIRVRGVDPASPPRFRVEGLPADLDARVVPRPGAADEVALRVSVAADAPPGDRTFAMVAGSGPARGSAAVRVRVRARSAEGSNERGVERYRAGRYAEAIADLTAALALDPAHLPALKNRAAACWQLGRYDAAVADLTAALRLAPTDPVIYNNRGLAHRARGEGDRALADYDVALLLDPTNARFHYNRAALLDALGRAAEARAGYAEAARLDPGHARARQAADRLGAR